MQYIDASLETKRGGFVFLLSRFLGVRTGCLKAGPWAMPATDSMWEMRKGSSVPVLLFSLLGFYFLNFSCQYSALGPKAVRWAESGYSENSVLWGWKLASLNSEVVQVACSPESQGTSLLFLVLHQHLRGISNGFQSILRPLFLRKLIKRERVDLTMSVSQSSACLKGLAMAMLWWWWSSVCASCGTVVP